MAILPIEQRLASISRIARTLSWDEVARDEVADGWRLSYRPAGQIMHPDALPTALSQLSTALAPYQARMIEYRSPQEGGPRVVLHVPTNPTLIGGSL